MAKKAYHRWQETTIRAHFEINDTSGIMNLIPVVMHQISILLTSLAISNVFVSTAHANTKLQPRCEVVSARMGIFYELYSQDQSYSYSAKDAEQIVIMAIHPKSRKEVEKDIPNLHDWLISTSVLGWKLGYKDRGLYMKKFKEMGYGPELVHPMSFSHWMLTQCEIKYPPN